MNTRSDPQHGQDALPSVPLFDPSSMPLRHWCAGSREDAVTGLVAFPDFHSHLPREPVDVKSNETATWS